MTLRHIALAAIVLGAGTLASASVIPIGEFDGTYYEGFENLNPAGGYPAPWPIMEAHGSFDDIYAHYCMIATSLYSFPNDTYIFPYNGNLMGGSVTGQAAFEFAEPVTQFGSWIGTTDILSGGSITFKDINGEIIDTVPLTVGLGEWVWYGFSSDTPFTRVEILGGTQVGLPLVFDDVRVTVPEPAALGLAALGAAFVLGRRR